MQPPHAASLQLFSAVHRRGGGAGRGLQRRSSRGLNAKKTDRQLDGPLAQLVPSSAGQLLELRKPMLLLLLRLWLAIESSRV
jgi:hypothetical protein